MGSRNRSGRVNVTIWVQLPSIGLLIFSSSQRKAPEEEHVSTEHDPILLCPGMDHIIWAGDIGHKFSMKPAHTNEHCVRIFANLSLIDGISFRL